MFRRSLLFGSGILLALSSAAMASLVDPGMVIDSGDPAPIPISTGINTVAADGTHDPLTFDFVNDLNQIITGFTFQTTVSPGFTGVFSCSSGYFLHCTVDYNSITGSLEYIFAGVRPPDGDEFCHGPTERNEREGIPPCGLFHITLTGWTTATGLYTDAHPPAPFINTVETAAPEPSSVFVVLAGLLMLAGVVELRRRKQLQPMISSHIPLANSRS